MNMENRQRDFRPAAEVAVSNFLNAAETLIRLGDLAQAELRMREALKHADTCAGRQSELSRRVLMRLSDFYQSQKRLEPLATVEARLSGEDPQAEPEPTSNDSHGRLLAVPRHGERPLKDGRINPARVPPEVRRACKILGLAPEDISLAAVRKAWKENISDPSVHPDLGGEQEVAIMLNNARDSILRWLEEQQPKLLKRFERMVRNP
jgi:hypothetical protein